MAKTTITQITDDLDGSADAAEVSFAYDGVQYTIDLSKKNKAGFEKLLKPYLGAATKVSRRPQSRPSSGVTGRKDLSAIRAWASKQGIAVSERGRISRSVIDQYDAAH